MERWISKLAALFVIMLVMLVVVFIPFKIMTCFTNLGRKGQVILARLNCFTGGIFLGTCLLFLLPEVSHLLTPAHPPIHLNNNPNQIPIHPPSHYPYPQAVILIGFLFIMYVERLVHMCRKKGTKHNRVRSLSIVAMPKNEFAKTALTTGESDDGSSDMDGGDNAVDKRIIINIKNTKSGSVDLNSGGNNKSGSECGGGSNNSGGSNLRVNSFGNYNPLSDVKSALRQVSDDPNNMQELNNKFKKQVSVEIEDQCQDRRLRARGDSDGDMADKTEENTTKAVILFIALAMDEILGGLSMGLQRSNAGVWGMVVGLLAHEAVVGFSFGLQLASLASLAPSKRCLVYTLAFLYALMTPLGAALGLIISEVTVVEYIDQINGVLQGLATGVFLYVTFFEILEGEIHSQTPLANIAFFTLGCGVMAAIAAIPKEENNNIELLNSTNFSVFKDAASTNTFTPDLST